MHLRWLSLLVLLLLWAPPAGAQERESVDPELLGEFQYRVDGVILFTIEGDQIIGRVTTPTTHGGIDLVGGTTPCNGQFAEDEVFVLDLTGVGEWFWFTTLRGECERLGGAPVTVTFGLLGADATGSMPLDHPRFDTNPLTHSMIRTDVIANLTTTTTTTTTTASPPADDNDPSLSDIVEQVEFDDELEIHLAEESFWEEYDRYLLAAFVALILVTAVLGLTLHPPWLCRGRD